MPRNEKTTVGELIAALRQLPSDMRVVVPGADGVGFDDVTTITGAVVIVNASRRSSYGKHKRIEDMEASERNMATETVAVLRHG